MLDYVLGMLARWTIGKKLLGFVAAINGKLSGKRSELILALEALIFLLRKFGVLDGAVGEAAKEFCIVLLGALPITLADKAKRAQDLADKVIVQR